MGGGKGDNNQYGNIPEAVEETENATAFKFCNARRDRDAMLPWTRQIDDPEELKDVISTG